MKTIVGLCVAALLVGCGGAAESDVEEPIDGPDAEVTACAGQKTRLYLVAKTPSPELPLKSNEDPEEADCVWGDFACFAKLVVYCRDNFGQVECDDAGCSCFVC